MLVPIISFLIPLFYFANLHCQEVKRIAVLICHKYEKEPAHVDNDELILPFERNHLHYEELIWDHPDADYGQYDAVIVRATWDYIEKREQFLGCLRHISSLGVPLFNSMATLEWNSTKNYLLDLENRGIPIIPTQIISKKTDPRLDRIIHAMPSEEYVIKPAVSGGGNRTFRTNAENIQHLYDTCYSSEEEVLIQPFLPVIKSEGEWSLVFFDGNFSHAVLKRPATNDFRVQRFHGGTVTSIIPSQEMVDAARQVLECTPGGIPLYGRVDFVRQSDRFLLMELELIEPDLFLTFDCRAAERFSLALKKRLHTYFLP